MESEATCTSVEATDYLPLYFFDLTADLKKQAKEELFEDEERIPNSLNELRSLIVCTESKHSFSDDELMPFLRTAKHDVEKAHRMFIKQRALFQKYDQLFKNFTFSDIQKSLQSNCIGCLTNRDADGCLVIVCFPGKFDTSKYDSVGITKAGVAAVLDNLQYPITQIAGIKIIIDYALPFRALAQIRLWLTSFCADSMQGSFPVRVKELHVINNGTLTNFVWVFLKRLLSKKVASRVHVHGRNLKCLHKFFPPSILPEEIGGELGPHDNSKLIQALSQSEKRLETYVSKIRGDL